MVKHYYSIGEVCNLLDLKPHVIRYWESEFPVLRPKRTTGYTRHYTSEKIELLRRVKDLLYVQKYTVKGVKKKLSAMTSEDKYKSHGKRSIINDDLKKTLIKQLADIRDELVKAGK